MSFLPPADRKYLDSKGLTYKEYDVDGQKAIICSDSLLPEGKYDADKADILIKLPPGYPDVAPDMFYLHPWVLLSNGNRYPKAADEKEEFAGRNWQRWSRHNDEWRPGIDGIGVVLKRVQYALETAR